MGRAYGSWPSPGRRKTFSRRDAPEVCVDRTPKRVQGKPGARCTRDLVCNVHKKVRTRAYRSSGEHLAFPAQWFYGLYRGRPGETYSIATIVARGMNPTPLDASFGRRTTRLHRPH